MFQSDFDDDQRNILAPRRSAKRLIAALLVVIVCFCAICAKFLVDARNSAWQGVLETTANLVAAIELDTLLNIESFDLSLQAVVDNLKQPGIDHISPDLRQLVLFDRSANARQLPFSGALRKINARSQTPIVALLVFGVIDLGVMIYGYFQSSARATC